MKTLLSFYIESLRPIIYIEDADFFAIDECIDSISDGAEVYEYSNACGPVVFRTGRSIKTSGDASLYNFLDIYKAEAFDKRIFLILKDIHCELDNPKIIAQLRHIAENTLYADGYHAVIFIVSGTRKIPRELAHLITLVPGTRPEQTTIEAIIRDYARIENFIMSEDDIGSLSLELKGLSAFQIRQALNLAYCNGGYISFEKDKELIFSEKQQMIEKSNLLEFLRIDESLDNVGGLDGLKSWLRQKADIFKNLDKALKAGVDRPRGVLILGVPGCGKSLTAKTTARLFGVPLVRLDVGRLLGKYIGESESNMRSALRMAEAISPCVLWIDEIEKAFAGAGNGSGHEVTVRLIGQFLTWMQEKNNTVFVVATANDVSALPPEFLRKGRFDEIFSVSLPTEEERREILKIHLRRRNQNTDILRDIYEIIKKDDDFSGADLEGVVAAAVETAFLNERSAVLASDLQEAFSNANPLARSLKDKMLALQKTLTEYNVRPASTKSGEALSKKHYQIKVKNKPQHLWHLDGFLSS